MKTTINKVMLYGVLAMMLTGGIASADHPRGGDHGERGDRGEMRYNMSHRAKKSDKDVAAYAARQEALSAAVMNNDFAAYNAEIQAQTAEKEAAKAEYCANNADAKKCDDSHDGEDMLEKMQEHFDKARANYLETGEVKIKKSYKKRGPGKHFKASHKGMVSKIIKTVDADRLERALTKINDRIENIDDEVVLDLLEGIRETIQAAIDAQE